MSGRARAAANVCFYKRNDVIVMGDFHLWSSSPTLAEFHRTPTSCRASEYNLPRLRAAFSLTFSLRLASTRSPFITCCLFFALWNCCPVRVHTTRTFEMQQNLSRVSSIGLHVHVREYPRIPSKFSNFSRDSDFEKLNVRWKLYTSYTWF